MSLFSATSTPGGMQVDVPACVVYVAHATPHGGEQATFGSFNLEPRLACTSIFYGSSAGGQSYAKLEAVTGEPVSTQIDVESTDFLQPGDRVCIGLDEEDGFRPLFAGYMVQAQISISDNSERLVYRIAGPEWAWGASGKNAGADRVVSGQFRRSAEADNIWVANESSETPRDKIIRVRAERTVFNPRGMKNRTADEVHFVESGSGEKGYVFEEPDRGRIEGGTRTEKAAYWTRKKAVHHLVHMYNADGFTGVVNPVFGTVDPTVTGDVMRDVDVDGMTLYDAIVKVCGPGLAIAVSPIPVGGKWGGFVLQLFSRSSGGSASLFLDPRGTSMADATPSVSRLEAVKDFSKTANRVVVYGQGVRHVTLRFNADAAAVSTPEKPFILQPGWVSSEGKLEDYSNSEADLSKAIVDTRTIDARGAGSHKTWQDRYSTKGKEFLKYAHVFRRFAWNESAEFQGEGVVSGKTAGSYLVPDLTGIADAKGFVATEDYVAGQYARRRRPLLDSAYVVPGLANRVRIRPIVSITTKYNGHWSYYTRRLTGNEYRIDPDMAAIWITVDDIAHWKPFESFVYNRSQDDPGLPAGRAPASNWIQQKTFATLLYSKLVWLTVEASIEVDMPARAVAERSDDSGNPHIREVHIRRDDSYIKSIKMDQSSLGTDWTSYSGMTAVEIDDTDDMQSFADQTRESCQDEQVQASIICEGDWPIQTIGKMANTVGGRNINLTSSEGRGAQIVAISLDVESMTVEHLTESAAMEVVAAEKNRIARSKVYQKGGIKQ